MKNQVYKVFFWGTLLLLIAKSKVMSQVDLPSDKCYAKYPSLFDSIAAKVWREYKGSEWYENHCVKTVMVNEIRESYSLTKSMYKYVPVIEKKQPHLLRMGLGLIQNILKLN